MKPKHRKSRPYHPHTKAERALTAAVLTALLSGASAAPAMAGIGPQAKDVTIAADEDITVSSVDARNNKHKACLTYEEGATDSDAYKTPSNAENKLTILGKVHFLDSANVAVPVYSGGATGLYNNHLLIDGGSLTGRDTIHVYGAFSFGSVVSENDVTIQGGSIVNGDVYGGYSERANAVKNTVAIVDSTIKGDVIGGKSNAKTSEGNKVSLAGGTVTGNVIGGRGKDNSIILRPGADGKATTFGKHSGLYGDLGAVASGNSLTLAGVKDVKVAEVDGFQAYQFNLGPDTKAGDTLLTATGVAAFSGNPTVNVDFSFNPIWDFGLSEDNKKITLITAGKFYDTPTLAKEYTLNGILSNYTGKLNADTKNVFVELEEKSLADGSEYVKVVGQDGTAASGNTVEVPPVKDGSTALNAIAALAASEDDKTALTGNSVTVEKWSVVDGRAVGAASSAGDVRENTVNVNVNGHVVGFVAGGLTAKGTADSNTVALVGNAGSTAANVDGNAYGGFSLAGAATNNKLAMKDKSVVASNAYGGYGGTTANGNKLTMVGASQVRGSAYGGYGRTGAADGNTLEMSEGSTVDENAYGGYGTSAESNQLTVKESSSVKNERLRRLCDEGGGKREQADRIGERQGQRQRLRQLCGGRQSGWHAGDFTKRHGQ